MFPNFRCRFSFLSYWSLQILTFAGNLHFWGWNGIFDDGSSQCNAPARRTIPYLPQCDSPQFFSSSGTYFRSQIFPVLVWYQILPVPVLFFSTNGKFPGILRYHLKKLKIPGTGMSHSDTYHTTPYHAMPYHTLPMLVHAIIQFCNPGLWHTLRVNP